MSTTTVPTVRSDSGSPTPAGPQRSQRRAVLVALVVAIALAAGLLAGLSFQSSGSPATTVASAPAPEPAAYSAPPVADPLPQPQPQPEPQPKPQPGVLAVGPAVIDLPSGVWTAKFVVANVGGSDMKWTAVGLPTALSVDAKTGTLAAGEQTTVTATVDHTKLAKGPFSLTLHISANDTAEAVTVTGTKQVKVAVPPGPGDLAPNK